MLVAEASRHSQGEASQQGELETCPRTSLVRGHFVRAVGYFQSIGLYRLEQVADLHSEAERDAIERLDGGRVLAQLDLREISQRHAGPLSHLGQRQALGLAALADGSA